LVSGIAAAAGVALSAVMLPALISRLPADIPRLGDAAINLRVLSAAVFMGIGASIIGSLAPALSMSRGGIAMLLRGSGAALVAPAGRARAGRALIVGELCAAAVLLVAAGLLARSVAKLGDLDLGFDRRGLLSVSFAPPSGIGDAETRALMLRALDDFRQVPGVKSVDGVSLRPLHGPIGLDSRFRTDRQSPAEAAENPYVNVETITPGYFRTMESAIVEGRGFTEADAAAATPVLIISRNFARRAWPDESPIGRRLQVAAQDRGPDARPTFRTVVGVAEDMRYRSLETPTPTIYAPFAQSPDRIAHFMVRTDTDGVALARTLRLRAAALNGGGLVIVDDMDDVVARLETPWRSSFTLFVAFAGLTVLMAAAGLYSIVAQAVASQTREIGIRLALGATPERIARRVIGDAAALVALGALAGLATAAATTRLIASLLFDTSALDPLALAAAPALLALVALTATVPAAIRASRTDPAVALRSE
jgi:predicted permease